MAWEVVDTVGDQAESRAQRFMSREATMQYVWMSVCMANLRGRATAAYATALPTKRRSIISGPSKRRRSPRNRTSAAVIGR